VVLHPAQWRLDRPTESGQPEPSGQARFEALLAEWRAQWRVPRHVYLTHADNRLLLDLEDAGHREQLRIALTRPGRRTAVLQEGLPGPEDAWLPGPGRHDHCQTEPEQDDNAACSMPRWPDADRLRPPGSDWLYLTLSGPRATEDALLAGPLGALAEHLVERGDADGWFFIRYSDPGPQLRMRVHGAAAALIDRVLPALARWGAQAIADGSRTGLSLETYERELERYGGPVTTELCERISCADSRTTRLLLASAPPRPTWHRTRADLPLGETGATLDGLVSAAPRDRLELALASTADLLASLTSDPIRLAPRGQDSAGIMARSGAIYRERQAHLRALIAVLQDAPTTSANDDEDSTRAWWRAVREALADRRARLVPLVTQLRDRCRDGTGARPVEQLVPSLVHMHANRLGLNRQDEQLMLGLLDRTLRSIRACP
jgi:hypothetical protein